jgi:phosphosulfolactate synthase (CoM biosynthesis protein A)
MRKTLDRLVKGHPAQVTVRVQGTLFNAEDQNRRFQFYVAEMEQRGYEFVSMSGGAIGLALFRRTSS